MTADRETVFDDADRVAARALIDRAPQVKPFNFAVEALPLLMRAVDEVDRLREALIRCAEIAGHDGEAIEAARSGAMKFPSVADFAIDAVQRLRADYEDRDEPWQDVPMPEACGECGHGWEQHEPWGCRAVVITHVQHGDNLTRCGCEESKGDA